MDDEKNVTTTEAPTVPEVPTVPEGPKLQINLDAIMTEIAGRATDAAASICNFAAHFQTPPWLIMVRVGLNLLQSVANSAKEDYNKLSRGNEQLRQTIKHVIAATEAFEASVKREANLVKLPGEVYPNELRNARAVRAMRRRH